MKTLDQDTGHMFRASSGDARSSGERLSKLEVDRDEIQAARVSLAEEQETTQSVEKVRTIEDLGMYHWTKSHLDTGITHGESVMESESVKESESVMESEPAAVSAWTKYNQVVAMRSSDSYELQLSVWDAVLFLGLEAFYWHEQLLLILAFLVNFILQLVFCLMVVHLGLDFAVMDDDSLQDLEVWVKQADDREVTTVCGPSVDYSESTGYLQMELMDEARGYFEEAIFGFSWGPLLTVMVIALWSGTMVKQATCLVDMLLALSDITVWRLNNTRTRFEVNLKNVEIISLTFWKFLWMLLTVVLELGVIFVLLVYGCLWMAESSSVTELLLNAVSLAFITETDELVFATIVPNVVRNMVKKTEALSLKPRTSLPHIHSMVSLLTILMSSTLFWVFPVNVTMTRMNQVSLILCDGL